MMPMKCQVDNCRSGYRPDKRDQKKLDAGLIPECRKHPVKKFPRDPKLRMKWVNALKRDPKKINVTSGGVCSKHFLDSDFLRSSNKSVYERKLLKKGAIPCLFVDKSQVAQPKIVKRKLTTSDNRSDRYNSKSLQEDSSALDKIVTLDDLYNRLLQVTLPRNYSVHLYTDPRDSASKILACQCMDLDEEYNPEVACALIVKSDLSFKIFVDGNDVGNDPVKHLVQDKVNTVSELRNVLSRLSKVEVTYKDKVRQAFSILDSAQVEELEPGEGEIVKMSTKLLRLSQRKGSGLCFSKDLI